MARLLITVLMLVGCALADDSSYNAAPSQGYGAPSASYGAPQSGYGAPAGYAAPTAPAENYGGPSYAAETSGYGPPASDPIGDIFSLDKLIALIPFFLAVIAAIIVAQIIAPIIGLLFGAKLGLAGLGLGLLAPLGGAKIELINLILTPFNLSLCTIAPFAIAGGAGKSLPEEWNVNPKTLELITSTLAKAYESYSSSSSE